MSPGVEELPTGPRPHRRPSRRVRRIDYAELDGLSASADQELREKIASGAVSPDDARRALAGLRQRHRVIVARVPSVKLAYDRAVKTVKDPAARVAELTSKFQGLQQWADHGWEEAQPQRVQVGAAAADGDQVQRHATRRQQVQARSRGRERRLRPARRRRSPGPSPRSRAAAHDRRRSGRAADQVDA